MILRFLVVVLYMGIYMPLLWSVRRLKSSAQMTTVFFAALEEENYDLLAACTAALSYPVIIKNNEGDTPLHWAVRHNNIKLVQWLLERKHYRYYTEEKNNAGKTPLDLALQAPNTDLAVLIVRHMYTITPELKIVLETYLTKPDALTKEHIVTLMHANYAKLAKHAVQYSGNCNELVLDTTLLHAALSTGDYKLIRVLLEAGACPAQVDAQGITALEKAQEYADRAYGEYKYLQDQEVHKEVCDFNVMHNYASVVSLLTNYQKDTAVFMFWLNKILESKDKDVQPQDLYCLQMLTDLISINMPDNQGLTALHKAVATGKLGLIKLLLACGADLFTPDFTGQTPFKLAVMQGDKPLKLFIELAYLLRAQDQNYQSY